ncbi:hypothetical protein BDR03DRAFT_967296 [Suillus americanus]|nr:hypothetical protein BDR03DRAFT_967296 [Suillus americanus]
MNQSQAAGQVIKLTVPEDFRELSFTFGRKEAGPTTIEITVKYNGFDCNCPAKVPLKRPTSTREDDSITEPESDKDLNQQPVQVQASSLFQTCCAISWINLVFTASSTIPSQFRCQTLLLSSVTSNGSPFGSGFMVPSASTRSFFFIVHSMSQKSQNNGCIIG